PGAILSALSAVWADDRTLLLGTGAIVMTIAVLLGARAAHARVGALTGQGHMRDMRMAPTRDVSANPFTSTVRNAIAWVAVILTLGIAMVGALRDGSGGLAVA